MELTQEQRADLLTVLDTWSGRVSFRDLPAGVSDLRNALHDDLHNAP